MPERRNMCVDLTSEQRAQLVMEGYCVVEGLLLQQHLVALLQECEVKSVHVHYTLIRESCCSLFLL